MVELERVIMDTTINLSDCPSLAFHRTLRKSKSPTKALASFVEDTGFDDFSEVVREQAKLCILDWLGAAFAGSLEPPAKIATSIIKEIKESKESTIIGTRVKTSCLNASLVNGIYGHAVELDDVHVESIIHPAASVVPAALAVAERNNASGQDLVTSVILGYEVEIRLGMAITPSHYRFWHTTGTCGTFGAAAAAGKILGLDAEKMVHALGIAGTQAAGLIEVFGTMSKPLNAGKAAMNGVLAALLAEKGFTSSVAVLEADKGYCRATAKEVDFNKITENLGENFEITNNIFKRHASCGHTHGAIDAVLEIVEKHDVRPNAVDEIVVETYPIAVEVVGKKAVPKTAAEAKFSLPYCVSAALFHGKVGLKEFSDEKLANPEVLELMKKVKVEVSPEYAKARLGCAKVTIKTRNGEEYTCQVDVPKGYPKNPFTKRELEEKFKALASIVLTEERITEILKVVNNLEKIQNIRNLTVLLEK